MKIVCEINDEDIIKILQDQYEQNKGEYYLPTSDDFQEFLNDLKKNGDDF